MSSIATSSRCSKSATFSPRPFGESITGRVLVCCSSMIERRGVVNASAVCWTWGGYRPLLLWDLCAHGVRAVRVRTRSDIVWFHQGRELAKALKRPC